LGDLLLALVFLLIMGKAYGQQASLIALLVGFLVLLTVLMVPVVGHRQSIFPTIVVLGPLMLLQDCNMDIGTITVVQNNPGGDICSRQNHKSKLLKS
jgi:hypothetical protein